jgi:DNA-binding response OmpR family regulator
MARLLVVDDEKILRETLAYNLSAQGFEVATAEDGLKALSIFDTGSYDLMILDIMLPGLDGFEVCKQIRQKSKIPILMLTARDDEIDRVVGLEVGADDYLVKPFSMRELVARVKAMLRRARFHDEDKEGSPGSESKKSLFFGNLTIDLDRREVLLNGEVLELKPKEFELLFFMSQNVGKALPRERILSQVWGWEYIGDSRTVDVHIRWLRQKIEDHPENPRRLVTVRSMGYRFEG